jgi:hypothetical protein
MAVGRQPVMANAMKAVREDVEQEAADELAGFERHHLALIVILVIPPAKANRAVAE